MYFTYIEWYVLKKDICIFSSTKGKGGEKARLTEEYQLMNVGGMKKLENNHLNLIIN